MYGYPLSALDWVYQSIASIATGSADLPLGFMLSGKFLLQSPPYIYGTRWPTFPIRKTIRPCR